MLETLRKEMQAYIRTIYPGIEDTDVDILVGKDSPEVLVIFAYSTELPGTLFEGIWDKSGRTITIAEYERGHEEYIYVD